MAKTASQAVADLRVRKQAIIAKWKTDRGCKVCKQAHPATLDLHHRDPASKHPRLRRKHAGDRKTGGYFWRDLSYMDLSLELAKCDVLCSNCHRIIEWERRSQEAKP